MIAARIGDDHFLVWRIAEEQAAALVPGLPPLVTDHDAWLLCAVAEFRSWRVFGLPGPGRMRTAAWLVPCMLPDGSIGNAFVRRFVDHALIPRGSAFAGWNQAAIRIAADRVAVAGQAQACAGAGSSRDGISWFDSDRCGLLAGARGWSRWPIAKRSWSWSFRLAELHSPVAQQWGGEAVGMITARATVAQWGTPIKLPGGQVLRKEGSRCIPRPS